MMKLMASRIVTLAVKARDYALLRPHHALAVLVAMILLLTGSVYWLASWQFSAARERVAELEEQKKEVVRRLGVAEVEVGTLRSSQSSMQQIIGQQQQKMADLERSLEFYRQLMVNDNKMQGIELNSSTIRALGQPGIFRYEFTFVQYAKKHLVFDGLLSIRIEGSSPNGVAAYNFRELINNGDGNFGKLSFKYFQVVAGELTLPQGFLPRELIINVQPKTNKTEPLQRKLVWHVEES